MVVFCDRRTPDNVGVTVWFKQVVGELEKNQNTAKVQSLATKPELRLKIQAWGASAL